MTLFWAWLAGVLTLINPCVLPLLPVIIAGALQGHRHGPLYMAAGLTVAFTIVGVLITAFGHLIGLNSSTINTVAAVLMVMFGIVLLVPRAQETLATAAGPLASGARYRCADTHVDRPVATALPELAVGGPVDRAPLRPLPGRLAGRTAPAR